MTAVETIESLLKVGVQVKDAFSKATSSNGTIDWSTFLQSPEFGVIATDVTTILKDLTADDVRKAIDAINEKKTAMLAGRKVADLPAEQLLQYSALLDAETVLVNQEIKNVGVTAPFLKALADALPTLLGVAKIILPLLL